MKGFTIVYQWKDDGQISGPLLRGRCERRRLRAGNRLRRRSRVREARASP